MTVNVKTVAFTRFNITTLGTLKGTGSLDLTSQDRYVLRMESNQWAQTCMPGFVNTTDLINTDLITHSYWISIVTLCFTACGHNGSPSLRVGVEVSVRVRDLGSPSTLMNHDYTAMQKLISTALCEA